MLVRGGAEALVVPITGVRRGTADNQTGLEAMSSLAQSSIVDELSGGVQTVREGLEVDRGCRDLFLGSVVPMCQVTTIGQAKTHNTVLRVDQRSEGCKVGSLMVKGDEWMMSCIFF